MRKSWQWKLDDPGLTKRKSSNLWLKSKNQPSVLLFPKATCRKTAKWNLHSPKRNSKDCNGFTRAHKIRITKASQCSTFQKSKSWLPKKKSSGTLTSKSTSSQSRLKTNLSEKVVTPPKNEVSTSSFLRIIKTLKITTKKASSIFSGIRAEIYMPTCHSRRSKLRGST